MAVSNDFSASELDLNGKVGISSPTALVWGADGRLYVSEVDGDVKILTVAYGDKDETDGDPTAGFYVTEAETLTQVKSIQNYNDDGSLSGSNQRQVTGIDVTKQFDASGNLVEINGKPAVTIYVTSSDSRIGAGGDGNDANLDTNSGVITRLTQTETGWDAVDIVRGLARSEENHATNGLEVIQEIDPETGTLISERIIVANGGNANTGAPSNNFAGQQEQPLSAAILEVDLDEIRAIEAADGPKFDDGRAYVYDLPTLDDPTRDGADNNDPFGGNDGLNSAKLMADGPVQIYSAGYRNAYDVEVTEDGRVWTYDNGANNGWGGRPAGEDSDGDTNATEAAELNGPPAGFIATNLFVNDDNEIEGNFNPENWDQMHEVTRSDDLNGRSLSAGQGGALTYQWDHPDFDEPLTLVYGGHANPTRAEGARAGLLYSPEDGVDGAKLMVSNVAKSGGSSDFLEVVDWFRTIGYSDQFIADTVVALDPGVRYADQFVDNYTIPTSAGVFSLVEDANGPMGLPADIDEIVHEVNAIEGDYREAGFTDGAIDTGKGSINGMAEYTSSIFDDAGQASMQGALFAASLNQGQYYIIGRDGDGIVQTATENGRTVAADRDFFQSGGAPLGAASIGDDLTAFGNNGAFRGSVWGAIYKQNGPVIEILQPGNPDDNPLLGQNFYAGQEPFDPTDNDLDGVDHVNDPFEFDADNGLALAAGERLELNFSQVDLAANPEFSGTIGDTGLLGAALDGETPNRDAITEADGASPANQIDGLFDNAGNIIPGGNAPILQIKNVQDGTAIGSANDLRDGLQTGVKIDPDVKRLTAEVDFANWYGNQPGGGRVTGMMFGDGTQSNFLRFVWGDIDGQLGLELGIETNDSYQVLATVMDASFIDALTQGEASALGTKVVTLQLEISDIGGDYVIGARYKTSDEANFTEVDLDEALPAGVLRDVLDGTHTISSGGVELTSGAAIGIVAEKDDGVSFTNVDMPEIRIEAFGNEIAASTAAAVNAVEGTPETDTIVYEGDDEAPVTLDPAVENFDARATSGDFSVTANDQDNTITVGAGANTITTGSGADVVKGSLANLGGDTITDFSEDDALLIEDFSTADIDTIEYAPGSLQLTINGQTIVLDGENFEGLTAENAADSVNLEDTTDGLRVTARAPLEPVVAINAGGTGTFTGTLRETELSFVGDEGGAIDGQGFTTPGATKAYTNDPAQAFDFPDTELDTLLATERSNGSAFGYNIDVPNGTYLIDFIFAEIYFGGGAFPGPGGDGNRVFDIDVEGQEAFADIDIHAEAGGNGTQLVKTYEVEVTDGQLNIEFPVADTNQAKLSGMVVWSTSGGYTPPADTAAPVIEEISLENPQNFSDGERELTVVVSDNAGFETADFEGLDGSEISFTGLTPDAISAPVVALSNNGQTATLTYQVTGENNAWADGVTGSISVDANAYSDAGGNTTAAASSGFVVQSNLDVLVRGNVVRAINIGTTDTTPAAGLDPDALDGNAVDTNRYAGAIAADSLITDAAGNPIAFEADDAAYHTSPKGNGALNANVDGESGTTGSNAGGIDLDGSAYHTYRDSNAGSWTSTFDGFANGTYVVELHFAELFQTSANTRVGDFTVNGVVFGDDYDAFAEAGGADAPSVVRKAVTVTDGTIQVLVDDVTAGQPGYSAIVVYDAVDPDLPPTLSVGDVSVIEGDLAEITITRTGDLSEETSVDLALSLDGSADASDIEALSGTSVTFAPNQSTATVTLPILDDEDEEGPETLSVILSNASGDAVIAKSNATVTIAANDSDVQAPVGATMLELDFEAGTDPISDGGFDGYLGGAGGADPAGNARLEDGELVLTTSNGDLSQGGQADSKNDFVKSVDLSDPALTEIYLTTSFDNPFSAGQPDYVQQGIIIATGDEATQQDAEQFQKLIVGGNGGDAAQIWSQNNATQAVPMVADMSAAAVAAGGAAFTFDDVARVELSMRLDKATDQTGIFVTFFDEGGAVLGGVRPEPTSGFLTVAPVATPSAVVAAIDDGTSVIGVTSTDYNTPPAFEANWDFLRVSSPQFSGAPDADEEGPTASLSLAAPDSESDSIVATVSYTDASDIDAATIDASDIVLSGPSEPAEVTVSFDPDTNIATYTFTAPAGGWAEGDYTAAVNGGEVADLASTPNVNAGGETGTVTLAFEDIPVNEYTPGDIVAAYNAGGPALTFDGVDFMAATAADDGAPFTGGQAYSDGATSDVNNGNGAQPVFDGTIYKTEINGNADGDFSFSAPVESGKQYFVDLYFAEIYQSDAAARQFDVFVEGGAEPVLNDYDIIANTGNADTPVVVRLEGPIAPGPNGAIDLSFVGVTDRAKVSGIVIREAVPATSDVAISVSGPGEVVEDGDGPDQDVTFTLTASDASFSGDVDLTLNVNGTMTAATVTFTNGTASYAVPVPTDTTWNDSESVSLELASVETAGLAVDSAAASATATVTEDDPADGYTAPGADPVVVGDFSDANDAPSDIGLLEEGATTIVASQQGDSAAGGRERDYITFEVAEGQQLTGIVIKDYQGGESDSISQGFMAITAGSEVPLTQAEFEAQFPDTTQLLGGYIYGASDVQGASGGDGNVLAALGDGEEQGSNFAGFSAPLGAGTYTLWLNQGAANPSTVTLDLVSEAVPVTAITLKVSDAFVVEAEGATLDFTITADQSFTGEIEVTFDTGTETDLTQTVVMTEGVGVLSLPVTNDEEDNGDETVSVTITSAFDTAASDPIPVSFNDAEATGTITEDDSADPADIDGDGILNAADPFAYDGVNGLGKVLGSNVTFRQDFDTDTPNVFDAGFSGILVNPGNTPAGTSETDPYGDRTSEATSFVENGVLKVESSETDVYGEGANATGANNTIKDNYQSGADVSGVDSFSVEAKVQGGFLGSIPDQYASFGITLGAGGTDDYVKFVLGGFNATPRIQLGQENSLDGIKEENIVLAVQQPEIVEEDIASVIFRLDVDKSGETPTLTGTAILLDESDAEIATITTATRTITGSLAEAIEGNNPLTGGAGGVAYGISITDWESGDGNRFTGEWDYLEISGPEANVAPVSVTLSNIVSVPENADTTDPVKVADIVVEDDGIADVTLTLVGDDAGLFVIEGTELFLQAGVALDFETQSSFDVSVVAEDQDGNVASAPLGALVTDVETRTLPPAETPEALPQGDEDGSDEVDTVEYTGSDPVGTQETPYQLPNTVENFDATGTGTVNVKGSAGNNIIGVGSGENDTADLSDGGEDTVTGTAAELDNTTIKGFTKGDELKVEGASEGASITNVGSGSTILEIDSDGDGTADTTVILEEDYTEDQIQAAYADGALTVTVDTAPTVDQGIDPQSVDEDAPFEFEVPENAFADDGGIENLIYEATLLDGSELPAWLSFDPETRTFSGTPGDGDVGEIEVLVSADDGVNIPTETTFALTVNADDPAVVTAQDDAFRLPEDAISVPLAVLANDSDSAGGALTIESVSQPLHGTIQLVDGEIFYTPDPDYVGSDSFTYVSTNGETSDEGSVTLTTVRSHEQPQSTLHPQNPYPDDYVNADEIAPEISPSGKTLVLTKVADIPLEDGGASPRMNSFDTAGDRIFVSTEGTQTNSSIIYELVDDGVGGKQAEVFFDIGEAYANGAADGRALTNSGGNIVQQGLRGIAFHPDFEDNGKLYTSITEQRPADTAGHPYLSDTDGAALGYDSVVIEWTVDEATGLIDPESYREVFRIGNPASSFNHPIRQIEFNPHAEPGDPDYGLLHVATGDGTWNYDSQSVNASQNDDGLGKILRVDPLEQQNGDSYGIPADNPFVGDPDMNDAVYALGFRNVGTISFAKDADGNTVILTASVGFDNFEEINIIEPGQNYGWPFRAGTFLVDQAGGNTTGIQPLPENEGDLGYTYPAAFIGHDPFDGGDGIGFQGDIGAALTGGHVIQNGSELDGEFIFADFAENGRFFHVSLEDLLAQNIKLEPGDDPDDLTFATPSELTILLDHDNDPSTTPIVQGNFKDIVDSFRTDVRFGEGPDGELYVLNKRNGEIYVASNTLEADTENDAPRAVKISPLIRSLEDITDTSEAIKVANITVVDDALGTNELSLGGADQQLFEIVGNGLYLVAGADLDAIANPSLDVTVSVDDPSVGDTPDATTTFSLNVTPEVTEDPSDIDGDGITNGLDPAAYDASNGMDTVLRAGETIGLEFNDDTTDPLDGSSGLTGVMVVPGGGAFGPYNDATDPYGGLTTDAATISGGNLVVPTTTGDIGDGNNGQDNFLTMVDVSSQQNVTFTTKFANPFEEATEEYSLIGLNVGAGTQEDHFKVLFIVFPTGVQVQVAGTNSATGPFAETGLADLLDEGMGLADIADVVMSIDYDRPGNTLTPQVTFLDAAGGEIGGGQLGEFEPSGSLAAALDGANPVTGGTGGVAVGIDASHIQAQTGFAAEFDYLRVVSNDAPAGDPTVGLSGAANIEEGDDGVTTVSYTVALSQAPTEDTEITVSLAEVLGGGATVPATVPGDVAFAGGGTSEVLTFTSDGPLTQTVTVEIFGDEAFEPNETFSVSLETDLEITDGSTGQIVVTINNDDVENADPTTAPIDAGVVTESAEPVEIDLLLGAADSDGGTLNVDNIVVEDADGNAVDYTLSGSVLSVDPGQLAASLASGESATVTVSYDVTDGQGGSVANTATLVINGEGGGLETVRLEAEDLTIVSGYQAENYSEEIASGGGAIFTNSAGEATAMLGGLVAPGTYDVTVGYFDENDGLSEATLSIGEFSETWAFDDPSASNGAAVASQRSITFNAVSVDAASQLTLTSLRASNELGRIDYIEFVPADPDANVAPVVISAPDNGSVVEGNTFELDLNEVFEDADSPDLTFSLEAGAPSWLSIDPATGVLSGTPEDGDEGGDITVIASDGESQTSTTFALTVEDAVTEGPIRLQAEDFALSGSFRAESLGTADGQVIRVDRGESGTATLDLGAVAPGKYAVRVAYFDENDGTSTASLTIGDRTETWVWDDDEGSGNGAQSQSIRVRTFEAFEIAGGTLALSVTSDGNELGRIDYVELLPENTDPDNLAPFAPFEIPDQSVSEGVAYDLDLASFYVDPEEAPLTVELTSAPEWLAIVDGHLVGTPPTDVETGEIEVTYSVSDGANIVVDTVTIAITAENDAPVASNIPAQTIDTPDIDIDLSSYFSDADGDALTYSLDGAPEGLEINGDGQLVGTTPESGAYQITVTASDGLESVSANVVLNVVYQADDTEVKIEAEDFSLETGFFIETQPAASGDQGIRLLGNSSGAANFTFDGSIAAGLYDVRVDYFDENDGISEATLLVSSDGGDTFQTLGTWSFDDATGGNAAQAASLRSRVFTGLSVDEGVILRVEAISDFNEFARLDAVTLLPASGANFAPVANDAFEGDTFDGLDPIAFNLEGAFTDPEEDELTYTILDGPEWLSVDGTNLVGAPTEFGTFEVTIGATDGPMNSGITTTNVFQLTFTDNNQAPEVDLPLGTINLAEGQLLETQALFSDPEGDMLTYSLGAGAPDWLDIDSELGVISGSPGADDIGTVTFDLIATDAGNLSTTDSVTIVVENVNDAPEVGSELGDVSLGGNVSIDVVVPADAFTDPDIGVDPNEELTLSATLAGGGALPNWITFDPETGTFSGTALPNQSLDITVTATDASGSIASQTFTLNVGDEVDLRDPIVVEAENFTGIGDSGFTVENISTASGGQDIRAPQLSTVSVSTDLGAAGAVGFYTVTVRYYDETDGSSEGRILVDGQEIGSWLFEEGDQVFGGATGSTIQRGNIREITFDTVFPAGELTLEVTSGGNELGRVDRIELTPAANPAPRFESAELAVDENVLSAGVVDVEGATTLSLVDGAGDNALFSIDDAGNLSFLAIPDFEAPADAASDNVYEVVIEAENDSGTTTETVFVTVGDVNEAPTVTVTPLLTTIAEDSDTSVAIAVADIVVADDALGTNTLSLVGEDADLFEIASGQLMLKEGVTLDAAANGSLDVTVVVDDAEIGTEAEAVVPVALEVTSEDGTPAPEVVLRVNAFGPEVAALDDGPNWLADSEVAPSEFLTTTNNRGDAPAAGYTGSASAIPAGLPEAVLDTARSSDASFTYDVPVEDGTYQVNLYVAELFSGGQSGGFRVFDFSVEGAVPAAFDNIDPGFAYGADVGVLSTTVEVTDGVLNLGVLKDTVDGTQNPILNAFELVKLPDVDVTPPSATLTLVNPETANGPLGIEVTLSDPDDIDPETFGADDLALTIGGFAVPANITFEGFENGVATYSVAAPEDGWVDNTQVGVTLLDGALADPASNSNLKTTTQAAIEIGGGSTGGGDGEEGAALLRINAFGPEVAALDGGVAWQGDGEGAANSPYLVVDQDRGDTFGFAGDTSTVPSDVPIAVLNTARSSDTPFSYEIPVADLAGNGSYTVTLHLAELFSGNATPGDRVFDVAIEGQTVGVLDNIDPALLGNGQDAVELKYNVSVTDGTLNIDFLQDLADNPIVNGIEVASFSGEVEGPPDPIDPSGALEAFAAQSDLATGASYGSGSTGSALLEVMTGNNNIQSSNFGSNSFEITNTGDKKISAIFIDVSSALYPDSVFDPDGLGGDDAAKPWQINSDGQTGAYISGSGYFLPGEDPIPNSNGSGGASNGGYKGAMVKFNVNDDGGFEGGETVGFSGDMDPNSIAGMSKGAVDGSAILSWDVGGISGHELIGSLFTVMFDDGSTASGQLASDGSASGSQAVATQGATASAPGIAVNGINPGQAGTYGGELPQVTVTGDPGDLVQITLTKGFNPVVETSNGIADLVNARLERYDFEANNVFDAQTVTVTIGQDGTFDASTLFDYDDAVNNNVGSGSFSGDDVQPIGFVATKVGSNGLPLGPTSQPIYLENQGGPVVGDASGGTGADGYYQINGSGSDAYFKVQIEDGNANGGQNPGGKWNFFDAPDGEGRQSGFDGEGYYLFGSNTSTAIDNNVGGNELLEYTIYVPEGETGIYDFRVRAGRDGTEASDQQNDIWWNIKEADQAGNGNIEEFLTVNNDEAEPTAGGFVKVFGGPNNGSWGYAGAVDGLPGNFGAQIEIQEAGLYTVQLDGRSEGFHVDYWDLSKAGGATPNPGSADSAFIEGEPGDGGGNTGGGSSNGVVVAVDSAADDWEERGGAGSGDLELGLNGTPQWVGLRFDDIDIPEGVEITEAFIRFEAYEDSSGPASFSIQIENTETAAGYSDASTPGDRSYATDEFEWTPGAWTEGNTYETGDLTALIESVIGNDGVNDGAFGFFIEGEGSRVAHPFGSDGAAPELVINWEDTVL